MPDGSDVLLLEVRQLLERAELTCALGRRLSLNEDRKTLLAQVQHSFEQATRLRARAVSLRAVATEEIKRAQTLRKDIDLLTAQSRRSLESLRRLCRS